MGETTISQRNWQFCYAILNVNFTYRCQLNENWALQNEGNAGFAASFIVGDPTNRLKNNVETITVFIVYVCILLLDRIFIGLQ